MSRSEAYGYAVARIRAMEPILFDASQFQRLLDAADLSGALKILGETSYASGMTEGESARFDAVLEAGLLGACEELASFVPDRALIDIFRVPYDFHNVKVLLKSGFKARSGGKKRYDLLTNLGSIPADSLIVQMESEDYNLLPFGLSRIIPSCLAVWEQTKDVVEIERLLDKGLFSAILELAKSIDEPGVLKWVRARIDSENIRNALRLQRFGFDASEGAAFLHDGGTIAPDVLTAAISEPFDNWGRVMAYSDVGAAISSVQADDDFDSLIVSLEKVLDDHCASVLGLARYSSDAPENVLAYLWGKEMEVKNIRTILVSKGTDSNRDEVRRLMRSGY
ncbi:MAG: V-type ATPase subunit [Synergistaceae bacterium]|jgi:V/A-type H+-transporting ATPase subunit C|nr:V-type ATPase subunit [Synergistaceae bacterium]